MESVTIYVDCKNYKGVLDDDYKAKYMLNHLNGAVCSTDTKKINFITGASFPPTKNHYRCVEKNKGQCTDFSTKVPKVELKEKKDK